LVLPGLIFANPTSEIPPAWTHVMTRPKFSFAAAGGEVKSFRLVCSRTVLEAAMDLEMQWTIPPDAGGCELFVFGAPNATFQLIEEW
jgi:hypothetical protein